MEVFFYYLPLKMVKVQKMNVDLSHFNNNNILINDWLCILSFVTFIDCWFLNIQQQVCKVYVEPEQYRQSMISHKVYTIQKAERMEQPGQQHCNKQKVGYMYLHFTSLIDDWNQTVRDVTTGVILGKCFQLQSPCVLCR